MWKNLCFKPVALFKLSGYLQLWRPLSRPQDRDAITAFIASKAKAENMGNFDENDLSLIVEADLSYGDDFEDEEA